MLYESAHVRVEADDGSATVWLDFPGDPPNLLHPGRAAEIARAVEAVRRNPFLELLVVRSAKPAGFSAGADPSALLELDSDADRRAFAAAGQAVTRLLADGPFVSVALVDGPCLGAGLELALACDYRLAVATPDTALGFPDVRGGLLPAWGGLTRLTRRVGARAALDLLLSGRTVSAREAKALGLVDHAFCARRAKIELRTFLDRLQLRPRKPGRRRVRLGERAAVRAARQAVSPFDEADRPAGLAAVRTVEAAQRSEAEGLAAERREFAAVLGSPAGRAGLELLRDAHRPAAVRPAPRNPVPPFPGVVGIVGDQSRLVWEIAVRGGTVRRAAAANDPPPAEGPARLTPLELDQAAARIRPVPDWRGFDAAGLVIAFGDTPIPEVEACVRPRTVITVVGHPVFMAQELADRPGRVAGLAFPVFPDETNLVEVVAGPATDPDTLAALAAWTKHLGFRPVVVSDRPDQVVRRILAAAWDEAVRLAAEGVPIGAIDRAAVRAGFGRGPLESLDAVGFEAARALVPRLTPLVAADLRGRTGGDGFYHHRAWQAPRPNVFAQVLLWDALCLTRARRRSPPDGDPAAADRAAAAARDRLTFRVVNEAAAALGDEAHAGPAEVDLAAALGADLFRPHGGPLRFADAYGLPAAAARLAELAKAFGRRFHPHPELSRRAAAGERFHDTNPPPARPAAAA